MGAWLQRMKLESIELAGLKMPFGFGSARGKSPLKFSKKKTYAVQEHQGGTPHRPGPVSRRNTAPAGILKRGGSRPVSFPALEDGMVPQEMAAAIPMPTEAELNELFVEMVVSLQCIVFYT